MWDKFLTQNFDDDWHAAVFLGVVLAALIAVALFVAG